MENLLVRRQAHAATRWLAVAATLFGCSGGDPAPPARSLIVGLDGATNKVIDSLIEAGELPNIAALARKGVRAAVRPERPILSPRIWTSFATGVAPEQHGIEDWVKQGPDGGRTLYSNLDRRVPAVWNIASAQGLSVGVVNWLITQPPDKLNGAMISDHAVPGMTESRLPMAKDIANQRFGAAGGAVDAPEATIAYAWPLDWVERSEQIRAGAGAPLTRIASPFTGPAWQGHPVFDFLRSVYRDDELTVRTALELEAQLQPELLMVYLPGIDRVSHMLWQGIEIPANPPPGLTVHPPELRALHRSALLDYYRFSDALLGRLMQAFDERDFVLVLSDHGFEASHSRLTMPGIHESDEARDGILYARGPGIAAGSTAEPIGYLDVMPTLLSALGIAQADDLAGAVAPFLRVQGSGHVASYADTPFERVSTPASAVDEAILEKLRTLGYIE